jgi:hypothetical protein
MCVQPNAVVRSRNHCCIGNTMHSVCIVELHVTVSYIKILGGAQQCSCDKLMSAATIKSTHVFM